MLVRGKMDDEGFIKIPMPSNLTVKPDQHLDVAVIKMRHPQVPNVVNRIISHEMPYPENYKYWFKWTLKVFLDVRGGVREEEKESIVLHKSHIPTAYYPTLRDLICHMVYYPEDVLLPAKKLWGFPPIVRRKMAINISGLLQVKSTEKVTRLFNDVQKGGEYFSGVISAKIGVEVSEDLCQLIQRNSAKENQEMWFSVSEHPTAITLENLSSNLYEQPLCHLMMDGLQESMLDGMSKPILYSFPQHKTVHEPFLPRFVPIKSLSRLGGRADVQWLSLWIDDESGEKVFTDQEENFTIELLWRWTSGLDSR